MLDGETSDVGLCGLSVLAWRFRGSCCGLPSNSNKELLDRTIILQRHVAVYQALDLDLISCIPRNPQRPFFEPDPTFEVRTNLTTPNLRTDASMSETYERER